MSKLVTPFQGVNGPGLGFPDVYTKQNLKISNLVIFARRNIMLFISGSSIRSIPDPHFSLHISFYSLRISNKFISCRTGLNKNVTIFRRENNFLANNPYRYKFNLQLY